MSVTDSAMSQYMNAMAERVKGSKEIDLLPSKEKRLVDLLTPSTN